MFRALNNISVSFRYFMFADNVYHRKNYMIDTEKKHILTQGGILWD